MVRGRFVNDKQGFEAVINIRREVFVKELGIKEELEFDDKDEDAMHLLIYEGVEDDNPVATGRLIIENEKANIGRVAVLKDYRGMQYGDLTVRILIDKAASLNINKVYLYADLGTVGFYKKIGFIPVGDIIIADGIHLQKMEAETKNCCKCSHKLQET